MNGRVLWIARDKDNTLFIYDSEPYLSGDDFVVDGDNKFHRIPDDLFPEITFENSPKRLIVENN